MMNQMANVEKIIQVNVKMNDNTDYILINKNKR